MVWFDSATIKSGKKLHQFWSQETQYGCHCCHPCIIFPVKRGAHFSPLQSSSSAVMGFQPPSKPSPSPLQSVIITFLLLNCRVSSPAECAEGQRNTFNCDSKALIMSDAMANSTKYRWNWKVWGLLGQPVVRKQQKALCCQCGAFLYGYKSEISMALITESFSINAFWATQWLIL